MDAVNALVNFRSAEAALLEKVNGDDGNISLMRTRRAHFEFKFAPPPSDRRSSDFLIALFPKMFFSS